MAYVFRRGGEEGGGEKRNFPNFESGSRRVVSSQVSSSRNWQHAFGTASSVVRCERSYRYDPLDGCSHRVIVRKRTKLRKKKSTIYFLAVRCVQISFFWCEKCEIDLISAVVMCGF